MATGPLPERIHCSHEFFQGIRGARPGQDGSSRAADRLEFACRRSLGRSSTVAQCWSTVEQRTGLENRTGPPMASSGQDSGFDSRCRHRPSRRDRGRTMLGRHFMGLSTAVIPRSPESRPHPPMHRCTGTTRCGTAVRCACLSKPPRERRRRPQRFQVMNWNDEPASSRSAIW
jgi:hypothetical protein